MDLTPGASKVIHKSFGIGVFLGIETNSGSEYIKIDFENYGIKTFLYPSAFVDGLIKEYSETGEHRKVGKQTRQVDSNASIDESTNILLGSNVDSGIVFNESYTVIGDVSIESLIIANYDLTIIGNVVCDTIEVKKSLTVRGNIDCNRLLCNGTLTATGRVKCSDIVVGETLIAESLICDKITCNNIMVQTTAEFDESAVVDTSIVAGEGIISSGDIKAQYLYAIDYVDCAGEVNGNVYEAATGEAPGKTEMVEKYIEVPVEKIVEKVVEKKVEVPVIKYIDRKVEVPVDKKYTIKEVAVMWQKCLPQLFNKWATLSEDELCEKIESFCSSEPSRMTDILTLFKRTINISYLNKIVNLYDYLVLVAAQELLPKELRQYDTVEGVFTCLFPQAKENLTDLVFSVETVDQLQYALWIIVNYSDKIDIPLSEALDKVFSSIGLRYSTVERALNGGIK